MELTQSEAERKRLKAEEKRKRPPIIKMGLKARRVVNRFVVRHTLVGNPPVFDDPGTVFPWTRDLEANWEVIRDEALGILNYKDAIPPLHDVSPDHRKIATDNTWKCFFLWGYGFRSDVNCGRAPKTAALVEKVPGLKSALFSFHDPGLHIPEHKGVVKSMLTCHLGLQIPKDRANCRMKVDTQMLHWDEGKAFVFDDMYDHEVWNDTDEVRVILLVQFDRPVDFWGKMAGKAFMSAVRWSPFIQESKRNMEAWESRFAEMEKNNGASADR